MYLLRNSNEQSLHAANLIPTASVQTKRQSDQHVLLRDASLERRTRKIAHQTEQKEIQIIEEFRQGETHILIVCALSAILFLCYLKHPRLVCIESSAMLEF